MNRRAFLGSVASGLVASWLSPRVAIPSSSPSPSIDLTPFCWKNLASLHPFQGATVPFLQEDPNAGTLRATLHRYATNGKVCIRTPAEWWERDNCEVKRLPPANKLGWDHDSARGWLAWPTSPAYEVEEDTQCPECYDFDLSGCNACEGDGGKWSSPRGHKFVECHVCKGHGFIAPPCDMCHGKRIGRFPFAFHLPGVDLRSNIIVHRLLQRLPGLEYCSAQGPKVTRGSYDQPTFPTIMIRFNGGLGLVSPLIKHKEK